MLAYLASSSMTRKKVLNLWPQLAINSSANVIIYTLRGKLANYFTIINRRGQPSLAKAD
jgi:hypothetical protein